MIRFTRRAILASSAALAACGQSSAPPQTQTQVQYGANIAGGGAMVLVRGKELYVETVGPRNAPALLYIHGGPGAGSYDFSVLQGRKLGERLRVIMFDQRGVLRSAPVGADEPMTFNDLVEDTEALRQELGVQSWSILGHSFGGYLGLSYALAHPDSVNRVLFENPTFDLGSSARELMRGAAEIYERLGDQTKAQACRNAAATQTDARQSWDSFGELVNGMPERNSLYVHGAEKDFFEQLIAASGLPDSNWGRSGTHQNKLFTEGAVFQSLLPRLPELTKPSLLIRGAYDRVTAPDQATAFSAGQNRTTTAFENSAHFAHFEEQDRFAQTVVDFVSG